MFRTLYTALTVAEQPSGTVQQEAAPTLRGTLASEALHCGFFSFHHVYHGSKVRKDIPTVFPFTLEILG